MASCVTRSVIHVHGPRSNTIQIASFADGPATRLRTDSGTISLTASHWFRLDAVAPRTWQAAPIGYQCTIRDQSEQEVASYQWHPVSRSRVHWPHLHAPILVGDQPRSKLHFPTAYGPFASFVRFLIDDLGVRALRRDWLTVIERAEHDSAATPPATTQ